MIVTVTLNPSLDRTLTVPQIEFNEMARATATRLDWSGKGINVSRTLQALGLSSIARGFIGGTTGRWIEQGLSRAGIAHDFIHIPGETRTNTVIKEAASEQYIKVNEPGPPIGPEAIAALLEQVKTHLRQDDIWILSGSLPPRVPADMYAQLVMEVQAHGAKAVLDTSGEALRLGCTSKPYLIKPNALEAQQVTSQAINSTDDAVHAAAVFLRYGVQLVALSLGADGLLLASKHQAVWARPPRIQVKNPVGAGDALLAGLVCSLVRGLSMEEMARWGVATGTAAALREEGSIDTRSEVELLYYQVQLQRLAPIVV